MDWRKAIKKPSQRALAGLAAVIVSTSGVGGAVAGLAVWVSGGAFDWTLAAAAATAFGTIALAVGTGFLAWETLASVRATQLEVLATAKLAELAERDQAERHRPVVVVLTWAFKVTSPPGLRAVKDDGSETSLVTGEITSTLLNIGVGPALDLEFSITYGDPSINVTFSTSTLRRRVMMPEAEWTAPIAFNFEGPLGTGVDPGRVRLAGQYLDRTRERPYPLVGFVE